MKISNKRKKEQYFINSFLKVIIILLALSTILNNFRISESTRNRDNISAVWEAVTSNSDFFESVSNKDVFVSTTYNDAYQINVADFYLRTNIRLAAFVWPGYIWDNFNECNNYVECPLDNSVSKINNWLVNISKGDSKLRIFSKEWKFENDWPSEIRKSKALDYSNFWYFNIYMITESVGLAYLMPIVKNDENMLVDLKKASLLLVSLKKPTPIVPSLNGACMELNYIGKSAKTSYGNVFISTWSISDKQSIEKTLFDIREVNSGTC